MNEPKWITAIEFEDITYKKSNGVARIAFNRPNVRNAFSLKRPANYIELFMMPKKTPLLESFYFRPRVHRLKTAYTLFVVVVIKRLGESKDMWVMTECTV